MIDIRPVPPDQRVPPRAAATVVLLRAGAGAMEVLLMRRAQTASNFKGAHVFPGGLIETSDMEPRAQARVAGLSAADANQRLAVSRDGLGFWVAVARECFEESGILLAVDEQRRPVDAGRLAALAPQRAALNAGQLSFTDLLEREGLLIPAQLIAYIDRWITPPVQVKRFDTRFFVAAAPEGQVVLHDNAELVESLWLPPLEVLGRAERQEIDLPLPTRTQISAVGAHATPAAALQAAAALASVPVNRACIAVGRDGPKILHRKDWAYAETLWADPQEVGDTSYDLQPDVPKRLDAWVTRVLAPNAGAMTGPGTNAYLVGDRDLAVIDPGPDDPAHLQALTAAAAGRLRWIVLTHTHSDHAPAAAALRAATGAKIIGRGGPSGWEHNVEVEFDRVVEDGDLIDLGTCRLRALRTPGHASNHVCYLLEETRMLFSGDHVIQGVTTVIAAPDGNMSDYLDSLRRLAELEIAILAPGHGYLIGNPAEEFARLIAHRLGRERKVRAAVATAPGGATLEELLPRVYDDVPVAMHPMAALSLRAHLDKLVRDSELARRAERWVVQA